MSCVRGCSGSNSVRTTCSSPSHSPSSSISCATTSVWSGRGSTRPRALRPSHRTPALQRYPSPLQRGADNLAGAMRTKRELIAKPDDDPIPFEAADGPELMTLVAVGLDAGTGVEKPPEHTVGVALLKTAVAAHRATRHEGDYLVHWPESRELLLGSLS